MSTTIPSLARLLTRPADDRAVVAFRRESADAPEQLHHWAEWRASVGALRDLLVDERLGAGARVALYDDDPYSFSIGLFACWQAGVVAVLPPNVQAGSLERLRESVAAAVGARGDWLPGVPGFAVESGAALCDDFRELDREAAVLELFTSGTTGAGKAAPKRLRHLDDEVRTLEQTFGAEVADARVHATASHQHLYGLLFRVLWPLASGRAFCCDRLLHSEELLPRLAAERRSILASVPAHLARLAAASGLAELAELGAGRCTVFSSGGPLLADTAHAWQRASGDAPIEVFGSTETGGVAHRRQRAELGDRVPWLPFAGVELQVEGDASRLRVRSAALSENEESGFEMGDRATLHADGRFELGGRVDRVVKIGEKRLELSEMESRLRAHPAVEHAALVPIEQAGQARVGAVVVPSELAARRLKDGARAALGRSLADHLARDFDRVLVPRAWRYVASLPEDDQGKVTVAALRALFDASGSVASRPREPVWSVRQRDARSIRVQGHVPEDLASLEGHFPGAPVVPGTALLAWAVELARELAGRELAPSRVEALKFSAPLLPGDRCTLRVELQAARQAGEAGELDGAGGCVRVRFRLFASPATSDAGEREFASGRLVLVSEASLAEPAA